MFAARPELAGQIDAVALHPYEPTVRGVMRDIARVSAVLHALNIPHQRLDDPAHVARRIRQAQTLAEASLKPVALLLGRDLMWEE